MHINNTKEPVGLGKAVDAVRRIVDQAHIYHRCNIKPPHYIINLDAGNGQTTMTAYVAESYADHGIRQFGGMDMFLEYTLDGSMDQMKKVFSDIRANAVYTNAFEGVISMDIAKLASHVNEAQVEVFLGEISRVSDSATLVLYVPAVMSRNIASLVGKIQAAVDNVELLCVDPYNSADMVEMVKRMVEDAGVAIEESAEMDELLLNAVEAADIANVKGAKRLGQSLVRGADFSGFRPRLGAAEVAAMVPAENKTMKEVK